MNFYSINDLKTKSKDILGNLSSDSEAVLMRNGKPSVLMVDIPQGKFDEAVQMLRLAKSIMAFNSMRHKAEIKGFMTEEEIEAEIASIRSK